MNKLVAAGITLLLLSTSLQTAQYSHTNKKPTLKLLKKRPGAHYKKHIVIRNGKRRVVIKVKKRRIAQKTATVERSREINILYIPVMEESLQGSDANTSIQTDDANLSRPSTDSNTSVSLSDRLHGENNSSLSQENATEV